MKKPFVRTCDETRTFLRKRRFYGGLAFMGFQVTNYVGAKFLLF